MELEFAFPLSVEAFTEAMRNVAAAGDTETAHGQMDYLLSEQLKALGYEEAIRIYDATTKWYA